jgi:hypothetical protein
MSGRVGEVPIDPELPLSRPEKVEKGEWSASTKQQVVVVRNVTHKKPGRGTAEKQTQTKRILRPEAPEPAIRKMTPGAHQLKRKTGERALASAEAMETVRVSMGRMLQERGMDVRCRGDSRTTSFAQLLGPSGIKTWQDRVRGALKAIGVKAGALLFEPAKRKYDLDQLHPVQLANDFSRSVIRIRDNAPFIPVVGATMEENNRSIPLMGAQIYDALKEAMKGRKGFDERAIQGLRYELEGLLVQSFLAPAPTDAADSHPAVKFTKEYQSWKQDGNDVVVTQLTPQSSFAENEVSEDIKKRFGGPLRYELNIHKDRITLTVTNYLLHVDPLEENRIGYDAQRVEFVIDPAKLTPKSLLLSKDAVTVTHRYHGLRPDFKQILW